MSKTGFVNCPEHGKQAVEVETEEHVETFARHTAKCPKCGKRLPVEF